MPDRRVLVVDDERSMRELLAIMLKQAGHDVTLAEGGEQAVEVLKSESFDLVITDLRMRKVDGLAVLRATKEHSPHTVVLVVTAFASTETAVEAMKLGAYDYITKPFKLDEIKLIIANALERKRLQDENQALRTQLRRERGFEAFVGKSRQMADLLDTIRKTADGLSTVMVTGESGTGKELVAQAIHQESPRRSGPFVSVNCGAIPETLMESELFGHVKGAFTGAVASTVGLFSAANGGTLFLDEVTEVPPSPRVSPFAGTRDAGTGRAGARRAARGGGGSRRRRRAPWPPPGRQPRHALPPPGHGGPPLAPGEAPARDPGARDPARRGHEGRQGGRALDRGIEPRRREGRAGRDPPRGSLLPPQRHPDPHPAAARAARGHPAARRPLHQA